MFLLDEIQIYLSEILGLKEIGNILEIPDKLDFLTKVLRAHAHTQPYQSLTMAAKSYDDRHRPTFEEVKAAMFRKEGGVCYDHHYIFYEMLKTLGFKVTVVKIMASKVYNHLSILIRNVVKHDDLYQFECGCGYPTFQPINLDFQTESPIFLNSFLEYKYIKHDGAIMRMHRKGDKGGVIFNVENEVFIDGWRVFYEFYPETDERENIGLFDDCFEEVLTNPKLTPFHASLRWIGYTNYKAQIIVNRKALIENEDHVLERTDLKTSQELIQKMAEIAPKFESYMKKALENIPLY